MEIAKELQSKPGVALEVPALLPSNGRLILQGFARKDYVKNNIIVPVSFNYIKDNQDLAKSNPYAGLDFYIVAMAPEVTEQLRVQDVNGEPVIPVLGDLCIVSERFEPILYRPDPLKVYFLIHWQDILGIIKNPNVVRQ